jgi:hypothetical protein
VQKLEAQHKAAGEFVELIAAKVGSGERAIHPETAISSAAWVAGSLLLRSFDFSVESHQPGVMLLSNEANQKGPVLFGTLMKYLANAGVPLRKELLGGQEAMRGGAPQLTILEALELLQKDAIRIAKHNRLSLEEAAQAAALATAFIVKECTKIIGAETAFNVAMFSFVEGSKTVPPRFGSTGASSSEDMHW